MTLKLVNLDVDDSISREDVSVYLRHYVGMCMGVCVLKVQMI